jgi:hypothetical protein
VAAVVCIFQLPAMNFGRIGFVLVCAPVD